MQVVYEDNHVIIVAKESGEIVQGDKTGDTPLSETVKAYIKEKYQKPGAVFLGVVHRLDRPVAGLVMFARTSKALARLNTMFRDGEVHKTYWALVSKTEDGRCQMADGSSQTSSFRLHTSAVAVVEAEKTAVILSAHYPQYLWLAAGGLTELTAQKLFPLRHHRIVLFPDTDPDQTAYTRWYAIAQEARRLYGLDIHVSSLLERRATAAQKQAKIDLVDFLF